MCGFGRPKYERAWGAYAIMSVALKQALVTDLSDSTMPCFVAVCHPIWRIGATTRKKSGIITCKSWEQDVSKLFYSIWRSNFTTTKTCVYGLGENWTGALGNGTLDLKSPENGRQLTKMNFLCPEDEEVEDLVTGWGHTAIIRRSITGTAASTRRRLYVCGRPHEFRTLLRLKRLPEFARKVACALSWQHTYNSATMDEALSPYALRQPSEGGAQTSQHGNDSTLHTRSTSSNILQRSFALLHRLGRDQQIQPQHLQSHTSSTEDVEQQQFHPASKLSILLSPTEIPIPSLASDKVYGIQNPGSNPIKQQHAIAASAGVTAVICPAGRLYTFGLNPYGQCGVGDESNNVWTCTPVVGLTTQSTDGDTNVTVGISHNSLTATSPRSQLTQQQYPIVSVALGLQHAIALDSMGNVYTFGKGERGQLGNGHASSLPYAVHIPIHRSLLSKHEEAEEEEECDTSSKTGSERSIERLERARARYLKKLTINSTEEKSILSPWLQVTHVSAGFNHCACITETNHVFIWGKHTLYDKKKKKYEDSYSPIMVPGLPFETKVIDISCGSRHTSILLEDGSIWAAGIAFDNGAPLLDHVVKIMDAPCDGSTVKFFKSCFDNTIVITESKENSDGQRKEKVRYIKLWSTEELRMDDHEGSFVKEEPEWVDQIDSDNKITKVDVGWLHTVVATKRGVSN